MKPIMSYEEIQEERIRTFPKNRICFLPASETAAKLDKAAISNFRNRYISIGTLKRCVEQNNYLPKGSITDEAMEKFLVSIGEMYKI